MTRTTNTCCGGFRYLFIITGILAVGIGWSFLQQRPTAVSMKEASVAFLKTLDEKQRAVAVMPYDSEKRIRLAFHSERRTQGLASQTHE